MQGHPGYDPQYAAQQQPQADHVWPQIPQPAPQYAGHYAAPGHAAVQQYAPAPAQYSAPGYADPNLAAWPPATLPQAQAPAPARRAGGQPVRGGGAPAGATSTRTRWLRVAGVLVGIALLAFAVYNLMSQEPAGAKRDATPSLTEVAGEEESEATSGESGSASEEPLEEELGLPSPAELKAQAAAEAAAAKARANRQAKARQARRAAAAAAAARPGTAAAAGSGTATRGASSLPYTGAEHWIAAVLGALLLGTGIMLQRNAVRIGESAELYQRGPLLRPFEALRDMEPVRRLADLLTTPGDGGDFVSARRR